VQDLLPDLESRLFDIDNVGVIEGVCLLTVWFVVAVTVPLLVVVGAIDSDAVAVTESLTFPRDTEFVSELVKTLDNDWLPDRDRDLRPD
jgi:hypothetical protein